MQDKRAELDEALRSFEQRLPNWLARAVRWLRRPGSGWVRLPAAFVLIVGGMFGFLPLIGFWMIPLGLVLIAQDVPLLQGPMARLLRWVESKMPERSAG